MGITLGIIVMLGVLSVTIFSNSQSVNTPVADTSSQIPTSTTTSKTSPVKKVPTPVVTSTTPEYTLAQVATHSNSSSCWSVINTSVYDLTSWINSHPGGKQAILTICGKDGTTAFENQHGGQRRPEQELASFFIGNYKK